MELVNVKEYNQRFEAEMAIEMLNNNGIDAILKSDDCGGARPYTGFSIGYIIQVKKDDFEKAKDIIRC